MCCLEVQEVQVFTPTLETPMHFRKRGMGHKVIRDAGEEEVEDVLRVPLKTFTRTRPREEMEVLVVMRS